MDKESSFVADGIVPDATEQDAKPAGTTDSTQGAGAKTLGWKAQLPDDLKNDERLDHENIGALARAYLESSDGSKGELAIPEQDDAEGWNDLYKKLGRPEKIDDYKQDKLTGDVDQKVRELAFSMGLNQSQFDALSNEFGQAVEAQSAIEKAMYKGTKEETTKHYQKEFGDDYEKKMNFMKRGAEKMLPDPLYNALDMFGQLNNPEIIDAIIAYGETISDDVSPGGEGARSTKDDWGYPE